MVINWYWTYKDAIAYWDIIITANQIIKMRKLVVIDQHTIHNIETGNDKKCNDGQTHRTM